MMKGRKMQATLAGCIVLAFALGTGALGTRGADDKTVKLFHDKCSVCHGDDGHGSDVGKQLDVADLHSPEVQKQTDEQLINAVTNGKGKMPPNKGKLTADQIKSLVGYVRELGKQK